jgi:hypothetical protein
VSYFLTAAVKRLRDALAAAGGAALVSYLASGAGAVLRSLQSLFDERRSALDFMTNAQRADVLGKVGALDVTAAINIAITAAGPGSRLYFPEGVYRITGELLVSQHRVHLVGAGAWATRFLFAPTANGTCLKLSAGAAVLYQGSVRGISFYSSDNTYTKTAIEVVDVSGYLFDDIVIGGSVVVGSSTFWSGGAGSIGIRYRGREAVKTSRLYNYADRPVVISDNPNWTIDVDHFSFEDLYLGANGNPNVQIDSGVNLTNVQFGGYNAWVLGTAGLSWIDTTSTQVSGNLTIRGLRTEQGTAPAAYSIDIQHNYGLQSLVIDDVLLDSARAGIRLRKVDDARLASVSFPSATREAVNVDATVRRFSGENCFWQNGATATLTGQLLVWASAKNPSNGPLAPNFVYSEDVSTSRVNETNAHLSSPAITLPVDATLDIGISGTIGFITVDTHEGFGAIFHLDGANNVTRKPVESSAGYFTTLKDTALSLNCYYEAGGVNRYRIQNKRAVPLRIRLGRIGGSYAAL